MASRSKFPFWQALNTDQSEIRILRLDKAPGKWDLLSASLTVRSIATYPKYDAISWAWGSSGNMSSIRINGVDGWQIPSKLDACLRSLGRASKDRTFWVDAICVDQFNLAERAHQVKMMERIFSGADTVWVWLGPDLHNIQWKSDMMIRTLTDSGVNVTSQLGPVAQRFHSSKAVSHAMFEDWWQRIWPMQEVVLARKLRLSFGSEVFDLDVLRAELGPLCSSLPHFDDLLWLADFRSSVQSGKSDRNVSFAQLLYHCRKRSTTNALDRVYGVLGVCTFLFGIDFLTPDYHKSRAAVYRELAWRLIERTGSLAFLNQTIPYHRTDLELPTWVPDLGSRYSHEPEFLRLADWTSYKASQSLGVRQGEMWCEEDRDLLWCDSFVFDSISHVFQLCEPKGWDDQGAVTLLIRYRVDILLWLEQYGTFSELSSRFEESFVQPKLDLFAGTMLRLHHHKAGWSKLASILQITLHLDHIRATNTHLPTRQGFSYLRMKEIVKRNEWIDILLTQLKEALSTNGEFSTPDKLDAAVVEAVATCYKNIANSRFFITKEGKPGLGPVDVKVGDHLAILPGGNVPYVLRKAKEEGYDDLESYVLVGESYVSDAMQGEIGQNTDQPVESISLR